MMGSSLANDTPTAYLMKNMPIIKNMGTQLPGILKEPFSFEKVTFLGPPIRSPNMIAKTRPANQNNTGRNEMLKAETTP